MTENNTNKLYKDLVCEDPAETAANENEEKDTVPFFMCIDTSGWNPGLTVMDIPQDFDK